MPDSKRIRMNAAEAGSGKITEIVYRRLKMDVKLTARLGFFPLLLEIRCCLCGYLVSFGDLGSLQIL